MAKPDQQEQRSQNVVIRLVPIALGAVGGIIAFTSFVGHSLAQTTYSIESVGPALHAQPRPVFLEEFGAALLNVFLLYGAWLSLVSLSSFRYKAMEGVGRWKIVLATTMPSIILAFAEAVFISSGGYGSGWLEALNYYPNGIVVNLIFVLLPSSILSGFVLAVLVRFRNRRLTWRIIRETLIWSILAHLVFSTLFYITST